MTRREIHVGIRRLARLEARTTEMIRGDVDEELHVFLAERVDAS
jgi:hypothetical protein